MIKSIKEYRNSSLKEKKKFLGNFIGHKVDEILDSPCGAADRLEISKGVYVDKPHYVTRIRHEGCAYSNLYLFDTENGIEIKMRNFVTGELEDKR